MRVKGFWISVLAAAALASPAAAQVAGQQPREIPDGPTSMPEFFGAPAHPDPVRARRIPRHPFMAASGRSNIHNDAYMSDAYRQAGPLGRSTEASSAFFIRECASITFDRAGRLVTICVGLDHPVLAVLDPQSLRVLATYELPARNLSLNPFRDFTGGGYFYLDNRDRVVAPTSTGQLLTAAIHRAGDGTSLELVRDVDLSGVVDTPADGIISALPDDRGRIWFATVGGKVGRVSRDGGSVVTSWRRVYPNTGGLKSGQSDAGSGTTPTLMGDRYVAITSNADPIEVVVYRRDRGRAGGRRVCREPVFAQGASATDLGCETVWRSAEIAPSVVPKLSLGAGLVYTYTQPPGSDDAWYFTALDFDNGRTVFKRLAGTGLGFNNNFAPVTLGRDGAAYVGVLGGVTMFRDAG